ncbi:MAG: transporter [Ignavibacterium sp.]|nr:MAG: transporter [Ignavibacterium sp.]
MNKYFLLFVFSLSILRLNGQTKKYNLSLNDAIDIALKQNPELIASRENIIGAKGRFWSGISLPSPEISVRYEWTPKDKSLKSFSERTQEVNQSFEFPTNYFLKGSKLNIEEDIAYYRFKQTEVIITSQIKSAYYNVLAKEEQLKTAEENLSIAEDFFKKAEIRYNVGEGTNLERLTAKVQFTEAKNNLEVVRNELKTAIAELNFALGYGRQSEEIFTLKDSLAFNEYKFSLDELFSLSSYANQKIKIAELNLSSSLIDKKLAWSSILPGFNLSYFKQTRDGDNGYYGASFGISVPLWFMFQQRGQIQEASANVNISESELQLVKNEVYLRLKSAFNDYENDLKQVKLYLNDILPQSDEIFRVATKSYDAGEITYLEYLQAKQTLITSKNNYIKALLKYYLSLFTLEETVGQSLLK